MTDKYSWPFFLRATTVLAAGVTGIYLGYQIGQHITEAISNSPESIARGEVAGAVSAGLVAILGSILSLPKKHIRSEEYHNRN